MKQNGKASAPKAAQAPAAESRPIIARNDFRKGMLELFSIPEGKKQTLLRKLPMHKASGIRPKRLLLLQCLPLYPLYHFPAVPVKLPQLGTRNTQELVQPVRLGEVFEQNQNGGMTNGAEGCFLPKEKQDPAPAEGRATIARRSADRILHSQYIRSRRRCQEHIS